MLYLSFPPLGWWWAALPAFALLTVCLAPVRGSVPRVRTGAAAGLVFGFTFFMLLLPWVGLYVGAYAAWGLSVVEALYVCAFGAGAVPILRAAAGRPGGTRSGRGASAVAGAVLLAGWWSLWEWVRSSWPFGGFPWGRVAFGQADGPMLGLAAWGGTPLLGFVVVLAGAALGLLVLRVVQPRVAEPRGTGSGAGVVRSLLPLAGVLVLVLALSGAASLALPGPPGPGESERELRVAVVQGNVPRLGLDFSAQRRAVLDNHVRETEAYADRVDRGETPRPDLVLWPENASDVSALRNRDAAALVTRVSERLGVPVLFGTQDWIGDGPEAYNTYLVWEGDRPVDRHDKHYIQPFGEWLPMRGLFERFFPVAKSAGHFVPGSDHGLVHADGEALAVATCFEVAFDGAARVPVAEGARMLVVPTNNATFGRSPMTYQQLAMSRVRAVEHHVPVVISATSGVSAVVDASGSVEQQTAIFEPAVLTATIPLGDAGTVATRLGAAPQAACALLGLVGPGWALLRLRRERASADDQETR